MIKAFSSYHAKVDAYDPWINLEEPKLEYGIEPVQTLEQGNYDAIILTVSHSQFRAIGIEKIRALGKPNHAIFDVNYVFPAEQVDAWL